MIKKTLLFGLALILVLGGSEMARAAAAPARTAPKRTTPKRSAPKRPTATPYPAAPDANAPRDAAHAQRMAWFKDAKFGMFIHWGLYAVAEGEWNGQKNYAEWLMLSAKIKSAEYEKLAPKFNPTKFDPQAWTRIAQKAGMKYMVITAKHHDGFAMYDSALTSYTIVKATPFKRDPVKELSAACKDAGLTFCLYYSLPDWHYPDYPAQYAQRGFHGDPQPNADMAKYAQYEIGQVRELLSNYGPIGLLWFDDGGAMKTVDKPGLLQAKKLVAAMRQLQPNILINNRLGYASDYGTPEQKIPEGKQAEYFETCMTLNAHWGWNKADNKWKEAPEVIQKLVDTVSKGGNFLLNVGPRPDGTFPDKAVQILGQVGAWMDKNGESIYGTSASPLAKAPAWGRITAKGKDRLYLHVFKAPENGQISIEGQPGKIAQAKLLESNQPLKVTKDTITLPQTLPDAVDTVVVVDLKP